MKTKIQRNLNLLVKTSLMIQKVKNYTETYHIPYTGDDESQKFKFTLEIRTIVAHLLAKRLV